MLQCTEKFTEFLNSRDVKFLPKENSDGPDVILIPLEGKLVTCLFSGEKGEYFSLYYNFENVPEEKLADAIFACNSLNAEYKWATFYVDNDNDVMIHDDAILTIDNAASEAFEIFIRILDITKKAKPIIMKAIYA